MSLLDFLVNTLKIIGFTGVCFLVVYIIVRLADPNFKKD